MAIYYTGPFRFPDGDAAAARVVGNAKALRHAGLEVIIAGWESAPRQTDVGPDGTCRFQGFPYESLGELPDRPLRWPRRAVAALRRGLESAAWLSRHSVGPGDAVVAYNGASYFLSLLKNYCRSHGAQLILDTTEWYSPAQFPKNILNPFWWDAEYATRRIKPKVRRHIVISDFLARHFASKDCTVQKIPPLIDLDDPKWPPPAPRPQTPWDVELAFAGSSHTLYALPRLLGAMVQLNRAAKTVRLTIWGMDKSAFEAAQPGSRRPLAALGEAIVFRGHLPQARVPAAVSLADYTVVLRPQARFTRAGFPTKLVESLAAGVPVIANNVGDIASYVAEGQTGFLADTLTVDDLTWVLRRAASTTRNERVIMRANARQLARQEFGYQAHSRTLAMFVQ